MYGLARKSPSGRTTRETKESIVSEMKRHCACAGREPQYEGWTMGGRRGPAISTRWLTAPVFGWRDVGVADIAWALLLGALGVTSITGLTHSANHGGIGASLAVLLMTAPVGLARRQPVVAAAVMAAGAGLSWGLFDNMVRCGVALPALFYVAFVIGSRTTRWRPAALGMALLFVDLICQAFSDPQLGGAGVLRSWSQ